MNATAKAHLTFGGSSAYRWLRCAGSVNLCATLPPQPANEYMAEGTRAHSLLELALRERRDSVIEFDGAEQYTLDDVEAVQVAVDYVNGILEKFPNHELYVERQVVLSEDVGGTADVVIYIPETRVLHVIDYKHGRGKFVVAEGNPQLKLYAAATLLSFTDLDVVRIDATIIQPRCQTGDPIRTAVYSPAELMMYDAEVAEAVALARADNPVLTPGDEQCHWCPAAHVCPAIQRHTIDSVTQARVIVQPNADDVTLTLPSADKIKSNPSAMAHVLKAADIIDDWLSAVREHAEAFAKGGGVLPGFKLVDKRASRKWVDEKLARQWFADETMLDSSDYTVTELLSVAQAEKVVKKGLGKEAVADMAKLVIKESSGTKLVPDNAPGDAINVTRILSVAGGSAGDVVS